MEDQIEDLDSPEEVSDFTDEIPVHGIIAPEGTPTGDGRMFARGALTQRDLPVPLKYEYVSSHGSDTSHAATVGTVDKIWRDEDGLIWWSGRVAVMKPHSDEVLAGIADGSIRGVSIDGDDSTSRVMNMDIDGLSQEVIVFDSIRTSALTVVSIPAFQEAYIDFGATPEEAVTAAAALKDCGCGGSFTAMQDTPGPDEALPAPEDRTGALITLLPEPGSPVREASSEDDAHLTFIWMGDIKDAEWDFEALEEAVRAYAAEATPITVPVKERGLLGDEDADVLFLEPTESLLAFRDGLLADETVRAAHDAAEQYPEWTPHVTLGYPDGVENGPARADFADDAITFDRIGLWVGSQHLEYPMGTPDVEDKEIPDEGMVASAEPALVGEVSQETFAPGTKDGEVGTLSAWTVLSKNATEKQKSADGAECTIDDGSGMETFTIGSEVLGRLIFSTPSLKTTNAGPGLGTPTGPVMDESSSTARESRLIGLSTSAGSDPSLMERSSTIDATMSPPALAETPALIGDAVTPGISSQFSTQKTSEGAERTTAHARSVGEESTTSRNLIPGMSGLSMAFSDGRVVPVTSMDVESGIVQLSNGIALESEQSARAFISNPTTHDGPGWITHPKETSRIRHYWVSGKGAAKIRWGAPGDFNRCRMQLSKYVKNMDWLAGLCANMHKEAIGSWPGRERGAHGAVTASASPFDTPAPLVSLTAAAGWSEEPVFNAEFFQNPNLSGPTQMRVDTKTGRVWGHIAAWGICHAGFQNECVLAPRSATNYASFKQGIVDTTAGEMRVAKLTYGIGHPNHFLNAQRARAHYDRTDAVRAYVNVGEDNYGIWFSGVLAPGLTQREINEFRAVGSLSGDWRLVGGSLEMIAAVAVSTPGFPIPQAEFASGKQVSLVSAGVILESDGVSSEDKEGRLSALKDSIRDFTLKSVSDSLGRTSTRKE